jgi:hypothetical protein
LLFLAVLNLRFSGSNTLLQTKSLLLACRKHRSINSMSLLCSFGRKDIDLHYLVGE